MKLYSGRYRHPFDDTWKTFANLQVKDIAVLIDRSETVVWNKLKSGRRLEFKPWNGKKSVVVELVKIK